MVAEATALRLNGKHRTREASEFVRAAIVVEGQSSTASSQDGEEGKGIVLVDVNI